MMERADWYADYGPGIPTPGPEHALPGILERTVTETEAALRRSVTELRWRVGHIGADIAVPRLEEWSRGAEPDDLLPWSEITARARARARDETKRRRR